jgi:hypothetical protein
MMAGKHWKPNAQPASAQFRNVILQARRASEWWRSYEGRCQAPLVAEIQPHISGARRLAYLLYGDWFAADAALGRAVRRLVTPWRRWLPRRRSRPDRAHPDSIAAQPLLLATLEDLTARQRAALVCRHYRGMDSAVTAGVLRSSEFDVVTDLMAASGIVITAIDPLHDGSGRAEPVILTGEVVEQRG